MKASDLFIAALEAEEVEYIFAVPGEENLDLLESLRTSSIELVLTRHEQGAGFMAATYGRLTGKAGVCILHDLVGLMNGSMAVYNAWGDKAPVVVLGAGKTALDYGISEVARVQGREIVSSDLQDAFLPRQDGWALLVQGVPAVLVSSALADRADFESFMGSDYHRASDDPGQARLTTAGQAFK